MIPAREPTRSAADVATVVPGATAAAPPAAVAPNELVPVALWPLVRYFLLLGILGFGGMLALANLIRRDLVEQRRWFSMELYTTAFAYSQIIPGPLVTQLALTLVYLGRSLRAALLCGAALMAGPFVIISILTAVYIAIGSQWWLRAFFDGVGAAMIGVFVPMCWGLAAATNRRDWRLWLLGLPAVPLTLWGGIDLILVFLAGGGLFLAINRLGWLRPRLASWAFPVVGIWAGAVLLPVLAIPAISLPWGELWALALASGELGVTATGAAIFPVMEQVFIRSGHWINDRQFLDGIALQNVTPGPPLMVAFVGYFAEGPIGAVVAALGYLVPVFVLTLVPATLFRRYQHNAGLQAFMRGAAATSFGALAATIIGLGVSTIVSVPAAAIGAAALAVMASGRIPIVVILVGGGLAGLAVQLVTVGPG